MDVKTQFIYDYPALRVDSNGPDVIRMKKVMSLVQNVPEEEIPLIGSSGSTDMGNVSQILNTNDIIIHGLGNAGSNAHGVNETVRLKEIKTYIKELIVFLCGDL